MGNAVAFIWTSGCVLGYSEFGAQPTIYSGEYWNATPQVNCVPVNDGLSGSQAQEAVAPAVNQFQGHAEPRKRRLGRRVNERRINRSSSNREHLHCVQALGCPVSARSGSRCGAGRVSFCPPGFSKCV